MTPRRLRSLARTWFWFILAGTLLGAVVAFGLGVVSPSGYTAHVTMIVTPTPGTVPVTNADLQVAQTITPTFAELATTRPLLDRVIGLTHVDITAEELAQAVTTHVPVGTSLLTVNVSNRSAAESAALANAIAAQLTSYVLPGTEASKAGLQVELTVVDPAIAPTDRDGPGLPIRIALGGAIALFLTLSVVFLFENIWPQDQQAGGGPSTAAAMPTDTSELDAAHEPSRTTRRGARKGASSTIGTNPLGGSATAQGAKLSARGVIRDIELAKSRPPE